MPAALHAALFIALLAVPLPSERDRAFLLRLAQAAEARTQPPTPKVTYDSAYLRIPYPNGDVPASQGVCADVVIRSYRALGIDLQREVHEDMAAHFEAYPRLWKLKRPDSNIDHRRVPNLRVFFTRHGTSLLTSRDPADFLPGDIVSFSVPPALPHIGIVSAQRSPSGTPLVVHNIGAGDVLEDVLFAFEMTGHYRYTGH